MGIEEVRKEILASAKAEAKKLLAEGTKEESILIQATDIKLKEREKELKQDADRMAEEYEARSAAEQASYVRKQKLSLEKAIVEEVFVNAIKKLQAMDSAKKGLLLTKMIDRTQKKFNFSKLYCAKEDMKLLKKYNPVEADISGGVILEDSDGDVRVDLSYESMLESVRQKSLSDISKALF